MTTTSLVFLHGFLGCKEDWYPVIAHLADQYRCYALDLPGHGGTPLSADLGIMLDNLYLPGPVLVGYSMGGRLALQLCDRYPQQILISARTHLDETERLTRLQQDHQWAEMLENHPFDTFLDKWYSQPLFASLRKHPVYAEMLVRRLKGNPHTLAAALRRYGRAVMPNIEAAGIFRISHNSHAIHLENPSLIAQQIGEIVCTNFPGNPPAPTATSSTTNGMGSPKSPSTALK